MNSDDIFPPLRPIQQRLMDFFKQPKPLVILIGVFLITLMAGTVGYLLGRSTSRVTLPPSPEVAVTTKPAITMQVSQLEPGMDHWKTFQNLTVGYTIQYPEGVEINKLSERDILITRIGVPYGGQEGKVAFGGMSLLYRGEQGIEGSLELSGRQSERITINGYSAVRMLDHSDRPYVDDIFIADSNNRRVIRGAINTTGDAGYEDSTYKLFHQILLTLKFIP